MKPAMKPKFQSLTQARAARDRLASMLMDDVRRYYADPLKAEQKVESILRTEGNWRRDLQALKESLVHRLYGCGIPDWSYVGELRKALEFIAHEERLACVTVKFFNSK